MFTVTDIVDDVNRGITANNMVENYFLYRLVYFINENGKGRKCYVDTLYENLRQSLENIIRRNLSVTNTIVISAVTVRKNGEAVSLLNRAYGFSLDGYFQMICEEKRENINSTYRRRQAQCY